MKRRLPGVLFVTVALGLVASGASAQPAAPAPAAEPSPGDPARKLFEEGTAALAEGKFADAEQKLRAAWAQKKSHDVAGNLGAALLKLGDPVQAARFLAYAVEHHPVGGKPSVKKLTEELLAEAKAKAVEVRLRITGDAPAPAIRVDGTPVEAALVAASLFIAPGERVLEASAKGYQTAQKTVNVKEGQSVEVELKLVPAEAAPRSKVPAFVLGGVGVASLIAGGVLVGMSAAAGPGLRSDAPRSSDGSPLCRRTPEPAESAIAECGAWRARLAETSTLGNVGVGLLIVSAITGAAAAGYAFWPSAAPHRSATTLRVASALSPQGGAVMLLGQF